MRLPWISHTLVKFLGRRDEQPDDVLVNVLGEKISSLRVLASLHSKRAEQYSLGPCHLPLAGIPA